MLGMAGVAHVRCRSRCWPSSSPSLWQALRTLGWRQFRQLVPGRRLLSHRTRFVSHLVRGFSFLLSSSFAVWRPSVGSAGFTVGEYFVLALFDLMNMAEMVSSEVVLASSPAGSP